MNRQSEMAIGAELTCWHNDVGTEASRASNNSEMDVDEIYIGNSTIQRRFSSIFRRSALRCASQTVPKRDPLRFFADMRLTPIKVNSGFYQVLRSAPGLKPQNFQTMFSLVHHGPMAHSWSLLDTRTQSMQEQKALRPIAILETSGKHLAMAESMITDLLHPLAAKNIKTTHYHDSWMAGGDHIGFQPNDEFTYEWEPAESPPGSGNFVTYLWQTSLADRSRVFPAARIMPQTLIRNPLGPNFKPITEPLWCIEIDQDRIEPHLALMTAFSIKLSHRRLHAWFANRKMQITRPISMSNFAFEDERQKILLEGRHWNDWEDTVAHQLGNHSESERITFIRVFSRKEVLQNLMPYKVIDMLNAEAAMSVAHLRSAWCLYNLPTCVE